MAANGPPQAGTVNSASEGGVTGLHADQKVPTFLVAPSTEDQFNIARLKLIPIACWRVDDIRFAFDSSFIIPAVTSDLVVLAGLLSQNPGCPVSIFGHADPVGTDDYNKSLSGRRATVVYALLISKKNPGKALSLWQQVSSAENWGSNQQSMMQDAVPEGTSSTGLMAAYLKAICPDTIQLDPNVDFLARGADSKGKGDYQGCSEFNPVLLFSQEEQATYNAIQPGDTDAIAARNLRNQPNRRSLVLIFRKGSQVDPAKWPCPSATGDKSGCIKRFWSDGEVRRSTRLPGVDRKFEDTKDTFACRFYQRISDGSPCTPAVPLIHISNIVYLNYPAGPLTNQDYKLYLSDGVVNGNTGSEGLVSREKVASGDYKLEVGNRVTYVSAIPLSMERIPWILDVDAANGNAPPSDTQANTPTGTPSSTGIGR